TATGNTIGGLLTAERNVIGGNSQSGIDLNDADSNLIAGNYIGLGADGSSNVGNTQRGVLLFNGATGNVIGTGSTATRNVISFNGMQGILLSNSTTTGNFVESNYIGTDATGNVKAANADTGITIWAGASNNFIGGGGTQANVISGNTNAGVEINTVGNAGAT